MKKIFEDCALELFAGPSSFKIVGKAQLEPRSCPYSWRIDIGNFSAHNQPVGSEICKLNGATLFTSREHHTTTIEVALNTVQTFYMEGPAGGAFVFSFNKIPTRKAKK